MEPLIVDYPFGDNPPSAKLYYGQDVRESLKLLPDQSIQTCCTSPPFWGLRDYGTDPLIWGGDPQCEHEWGLSDRIDPVPPVKRQCKGCGRFGSTRWVDESSVTTVCENCGLETDHDEVDTKGSIGVKDTSNSEDWTKNRTRVPYTGFCQKCGAWRGSFGLEPTPDLYVEHMVEIFREIRRVLRDDGTVWLNLGDSYMSAPAKNISGFGGFQGERIRHQEGYEESRAVFHRPKAEDIGLKFKDLVGIPWMVAFALRKDGWYLRSDVIWAKANPLPESTRDRPTKAHEYVFLLTKQEKYFYDQEAIRENAVTDDPRYGTGSDERQRSGESWLKESSPGNPHSGFKRTDFSGGRNKRSVWNVNPQPYKGSHFATWPEKLVEPMILAGTSEHGACSVCGAPWQRIVTKGEADEEHKKACGADKSGGYVGQAIKDYGGTKAENPSDVKRRILEGMRKKTYHWEPTCKCGSSPTARCVVLDPFSGSATTGLVAMKNGRNYIGIDLNADYLELAMARLTGRAAPVKSDEEDEETDVMEFLT